MPRESRDKRDHRKRRSERARTEAVGTEPVGADPRCGNVKSKSTKKRDLTIKKPLQRCDEAPEKRDSTENDADNARQDKCGYSRKHHRHRSGKMRTNPRKNRNKHKHMRKIRPETRRSERLNEVTVNRTLKIKLADHKKSSGRGHRYTCRAGAPPQLKIECQRKRPFNGITVFQWNAAEEYRADENPSRNPKRKSD